MRTRLENNMTNCIVLIYDENETRQRCDLSYNFALHGKRN